MTRLDSWRNRAPRRLTRALEIVLLLAVMNLDLVIELADEREILR
ncbi:hypothetical protein [Rhodopseudomonas sp. P2A-2r]|nr:hypothetical protein [Rhodopseudomonas sp. P2A-2r]UZE49150.1 hypothetical protein ONR75_31405 [Rhodopseudomonas sp. P2A-2r]